MVFGLMSADLLAGWLNHVVVAYRPCGSKMSAPLPLSTMPPDHALRNTAQQNAPRGLCEVEMEKSKASSSESWSQCYQYYHCQGKDLTLNKVSQQPLNSDQTEREPDSDSGNCILG